MKILRADDHKRMPWKNGKGETVEIAVYPSAASVSDFDWRISMAGVDNDGPFSVFEGIDRTLSVLSGDGVVLNINGAQPVTLWQTSEPHFFPADVVTDAALTRGPITDLNVMTRRGRFRHAVERRVGGEFVMSAPQSGLRMILAVDHCGIGGGDRLGPLDALFLEPGEPSVSITASDAVCLYQVTIWPAER